jgi:hypothetical protein
MTLSRLLAGGLAFSIVACAPPVGEAGTGLHLDAGSSTDPHDASTQTTGDGGGTPQAGDTGTQTTDDSGGTPQAGDTGTQTTDDSGGTPQAGDTGTQTTGDSGGTPQAGDTGTQTTGDSGALGPWASTADYPLAANDCVGTTPNLYCAPQSCVANLGSVYCVGAASTSTYSSQLSSAGLGFWTRGADYPEAVADVSCVVSSNAIYCVGGRVGDADGGTSTTADVYYAPLLSPGIGTWTASTPYPHAVFAPTCLVDSGTIYCVAGDDTYYAALSSSGVGAWAPTTPPPTATEGCVAIGGYAYCFGAGDCPPDGPGGDCYSPSYVAPLSASGFGAWTDTTDLPTAVSANYAAAGSTIYYLSIPIFFSSVSDGAIGPWQTTTNYPESIYPSNCVSSQGYLYCASTVAGASYFAPIGVTNPNALQLENPPPFPRSAYLVPSCTSDGCATVNGVGAPVFGKNIDDAVVFDCASQASTIAGCTTTVTSPDAVGNYDMTIWYPCTSATPADTNCCFLPAVGYPTPFDEWCISTGSNSFIIASEITLQPAQLTVATDAGSTLPP